MKLRKIALFSLAASAVIASSLAFARPLNPFYRIYYTDATQSTVAGTYYQGCNSATRTGVITSYYSEEVYTNIVCYKEKTDY